MEKAGGDAPAPVDKKKSKKKGGEKDGKGEKKVAVKPSGNLGSRLILERLR